MEKEKKTLLESKIRKQLSAIMKLPNRQHVLATIVSVLGEDPESNKDLRIFIELLQNESRKKDHADLRKSSVFSMAGFLWQYESTYMLCVDILCYMLVANDHDLLDPIKRQYVDLIEEINEVDTSTKLKFLERHDFAIISPKQDQKLRNKIAHHDYRFDQSGKVRLGNESLDILSRYIDFASFTNDVFITICHCLEDYLGISAKSD